MLLEIASLKEQASEAVAATRSADQRLAEALKRAKDAETAVRISQEESSKATKKAQARVMKEKNASVAMKEQHLILENQQEGISLYYRAAL